GAAKGGDCADGEEGQVGTRRWRRQHGRDRDERFRRAQRQLARKAASPLRDGARRPDFLISGEDPSALGHAVGGAADPGRGRDHHGPRPQGFRFLTTYFVVVEWAALIFAVGAVFVLRRKVARAARPFRT